MDPDQSKLIASIYASLYYLMMIERQYIRDLDLFIFNLIGITPYFCRRGGGLMMNGLTNFQLALDGV